MIVMMGVGEVSVQRFEALNLPEVIYLKRMDWNTLLYKLT
jgi:hypothetical protein